MSFPYTPNLQDEKIESLQTQYDYLKLLRLRHLQWMSSTIDADIQDRHLEVAELIEQIMDQYRELFDLPPQQSDAEQRERS